MIKKILMMTAWTLFVAQSAMAGNWRPIDTAHQITYLGVNAGDLASSWSVTNPSSNTYEINPILGAHPSPLRLVATFACTAALHHLIARNLPPEWRDMWFRTTIDTKWSMAERNYSIDTMRKEAAIRVSMTWLW